MSQLCRFLDKLGSFVLSMCFWFPEFCFDLVFFELLLVEVYCKFWSFLGWFCRWFVVVIFMFAV